MTSDEALQFLRHAFMCCYDEDDDDTFESRVVHNDPYYHPDVPGWCYRPADDAVEPRPDWNGGDAAWREGYPTGDQLER